MKIKHIAICFLVFTIQILSAQDRVPIKGIVTAKSGEVEGITIYNKSSNKGTVSNQNGEFTIAVKLNDKLHIESLQFKTIAVVVDMLMLKTKVLKIAMVDDVNQLNQVVVTPYDLSGDITVDIDNAEALKQIVFTMGSINNYELADDNKSAVTNEVLNEGLFYNGVNFVALAGMLLESIFTKPSKAQNKNNRLSSVPDVIAKNRLTDSFTLAQIETILDVPQDKVEAFIAHINAHEQTDILRGNPMEFLEFVLKERDVFLKAQTTTD